MLSLPYVFEGIGRSNNYVESFNVAYTMSELSSQVRVFTPIIPNSRLVIAANGLEAGKWQLDLFINPMEYLVLVGAVAVTVLLLMGMVILVMHWQEKKEDRKTALNIDF